MKKRDILSLIDLILVPALLIGFGVILVVNPDSGSALVAKVLGWALLLGGIGFGIAALTAKTGTLGKVVTAVVCLAVGGWLLSNPLVLAKSIGRILGILLIVWGSKELRSASLKQGKILSLVVTILGVVLFLLPMTTSRLLMMACGVVVFLVGLSMLLERLKERRLTEGDDPNIIDAL